MHPVKYIKFYILFTAINLPGVYMVSSAQTVNEKKSIKDTVELNKVIKNINLTEAKTINRDEVKAILEASLILKDTATFYEFIKNISIDYYERNGLNQEAILFLKDCQRIIGTENTPFGDLNNGIGNQFASLEFFAEALDYYFKSVEWYEKYQNPKTTVPLGNIAEIYFQNKNFNKALEYNELALVIHLS